MLAGDKPAEAEEKEGPLKKSNLELLEALKEECLACRRCVLREGCQQVVFGGGNLEARLVLVGEGPGAEEDQKGVPFVGRAGQLLEKILTAAKIRREDVFITNVVKCRPPRNRMPAPNEVEACLPFLKQQLDLINPEIVVCLGALATKTLIDKKAAITRTRGIWHTIEGRQVMATFHPAALLRDPSRKKAVWEDFQKIMEVYHPALD